MKTALRTLTSISIALLFAISAQAERAHQDFGSLIEENTAAQKQLSNDLQKQLKTKDLGKAENPNFKKVGEQVLGKGQAENVAVETSDASDSKNNNRSADIERTNFKRLSQELKDIK